jgi:hypothetical protein
LNATLIAPASANSYQETLTSSQIILRRCTGVLPQSTQPASPVPFGGHGRGGVFQHTVDTVSGSPALRPDKYRANVADLRVALGIDVKLRQGFSLRYSFSETVSSNPVSGQ